MKNQTSQKKSVLFLCIGNSCRSQLAEALLRKHAGQQFKVFSAGLEPSVINPYTIRVLEETGIDPSQQFSKPLTKYLNDQYKFDYLITVCSDAEERCPVFPGSGVRLHWPFEDPAGFIGSKEETLEKFRETRDLINTRIQAWLSEDA